MIAPASGKPADLRRLLANGTHPVPGAFNAAVALLVERIGFPAVYVSGAATANGMAGLPDVGLLSREEVLRHTRYLTSAVSLPVIVDTDTGFGGPIQVYRTVREFEAAGVAGIQIEDQEDPKRCGHLEGKRLISTADMERKIRAAVEARRDPDLVLIARTDARAVEGLDAAIERARRYAEAGADALFPDGLTSAEEFDAIVRATPIPVIANMTEFGKTPLLTLEEFTALGCRIVLYPLTAFRVAMQAMERALQDLWTQGTQRDWIDRMQTRRELYELLSYPDYVKLDDQLAGYD